MLLGKYIGDKQFYVRVLRLAVPIMIQNGITNFVNMLDNIMVGAIGTNEMTGVAVANQLIFVFNLCVFGAVSGAGIFVAQFHGNGNTKGVRDTFRFKMMVTLLLTVAAVAVFLFAGEPLVNAFLKGEGSDVDPIATLGFAKEYINIMLIGLIPYAIVQSYSSTLRETDKTVLPMIAGLTAVLVNLSLNYVLIFGKFGVPVLGVAGAAIATVISRFAELAIIVIWTAIKRKENLFIIGAFKSLRVPLPLVGQIVKKGFPLMANEALWASGIAVLNMCYSLKGTDVVPANNIQQTFFNVFSVVFMSIGVTIGIIVGQQLGAGHFDEAKNTAIKMRVFSVAVSVIVGAVYFIMAEYVPYVYDTTDEIRRLATNMMRICALAMPIDAYAHASYFTLRSGGKTFITILFDSCFVWVISVPTALILANFTAMPILPLFAICQAINFIKDILGYILVKKGIWLNKIVE